MNQIMDRKMSTSVLTVFYILLLTLVTLALVVPVHAAPKNVYYVDDDGGYDFTTIQAAIDACISGDKIHVYAGEYTENLVIDVSITLTGEDPTTTIIDGSGGSSCIYVDNVMVSITGFTIMDGRARGIYLYDSCAGSIITVNTISGNSQDGIFMLGSDECTIKGNTIENNGNYGIYMRIDCDDNEIIGNTITGNYLENIFLFSDSDRNLVKGNEISYSETGQGILMNYLCDNSTIIGNEITDNDKGGIRMSTCQRNEISRNHVLRNGNYGIDLYYNDDYNTIKNNIALDNTPYDLYQDSTSDFNTWKRNTYGTSSIN